MEYSRFVLAIYAPPYEEDTSTLSQQYHIQGNGLTEGSQTNYGAKGIFSDFWGNRVVFGALTTLAGGIGLLTGIIAAPLQWLEGSPFVDYTIPGLALATIVGGSMLLAAAMIFSGHEIGVLASGFAGLAMMIFDLVEVAVIDPFAGSSLSLAITLQVFFFAMGLAIFILALILWMAEFRSMHFPAKRMSHA